MTRYNPRSNRRENLRKEKRSTPITPEQQATIDAIRRILQEDAYGLPKDVLRADWKRQFASLSRQSRITPPIRNDDAPEPHGSRAQGFVPGLFLKGQ